MREGYFAARGLVIDLTFTAGSAAQLAGLARGEYDLIQTAPDNVINYATQPAAFSRPVVTDLLRTRLGFAGVVVSDDLGRAVAVAAVPAAQRAVRV